MVGLLALVTASVFFWMTEALLRSVVRQIF